ncbi:RND multidrug efflux transporter; Acriflavin resistance protein [invertebrate metagenome]|uniref:RND multidrug efflux transporter Acriflavin resistance protein n=1 Tax=invertebrate metagenome TaxID=1711999 RepID=A0A484H523_9ZZZZ
MILIRLSIVRPLAVVAVVLMIVLFGVAGLWRIPVQLIPNVHEPAVTVTTGWPGAFPAEIEREILERQEEALKGLSGMRNIYGAARKGMATITLEFSAGTDMNSALLRTANQLQQISGNYPKEAGQPKLWMASSEDQPMAILVLSRMPGNNRSISTYGDFIDNVVREQLERVPGVASADVYGGKPRELQILVDPVTLASYNLNVQNVIDALSRAHIAASVSEIDEGKRRYVVRMTSELATPEQVRAVLLRVTEENGRMRRITVGDVATEITFSHKEWRFVVRYLGQPAMSIYVVRELSANALQTMRGIWAVMTELNKNVLKREGLFLELSYDESIYINAAIDMVMQNIYIGGFLASVVLLLFLRSLSATVIVVLSIPVSIIGSFIGMALLGRTLNVISLAGMAFAVGMVVDAAIVVLENIFRLRQEGKSRIDAAYTGTVQVWGAILASALTTVMVFIPVLTLELEIGQVFRDIAIALSVTVMLSLIVAITVIPALACRLLGDAMPSKPPIQIPVVDKLAQLFVAFIIGFIQRVSTSKLLSILVIIITTVILGLISWILLPPFDYLPHGTYNAMSVYIRLPSGYNLDSTIAIADAIEDTMRPLWSSGANLRPELTRLPKIKMFFLRAFRGGVFIEITTVDPRRTTELRPLLYEAIHHEPGAVGYVMQPPLLKSIGGMGSTGGGLGLNVSGHDLKQILVVARRTSQLFKERLPPQKGYMPYSRSALELGVPEVRITPNPLRLADAGLTAQNLSQTVSAFSSNGLQIDELLVDGHRIPMILRGPENYITRTQDLDAIPIVTPSGRILPLAALANIRMTAGPTEILHVERRRTVSLGIGLGPSISLETGIEQVQKQIVDTLRAEGLPPGITLALSGSVDMLTEAWDVVMWQLLLAVSICYLLMVVLYESFIYPLLIMIAVPQATAGAVMGLIILNLWESYPLDMLTLLGFVILIGTVVNNAILIVHQTLHHIRAESMLVNNAIEAAVRSRLRPIFMTTLTTLFGMLPLAMLPGTGTELYRGLGTVVLGGMALSAILTLLILPPLLSLVAGMLERQPSSKR